MKPVLNNPIPPDLNNWLTVFPGLKLAYAQLKEDVRAGKQIIPTVYYDIAEKENNTNPHRSILAIRMAVFIWVETGLFDADSFSGLFWSHGDQLVQYGPTPDVKVITADESETPVPQKGEIIKNALVIIGTNKNQTGALIYVVEDKILRWEMPTDEHEFQKAELPIV